MCPPHYASANYGHKNVPVAGEGLTNGWYTHYTDCLAAIQCEPSTYKCAIGTCTDCSGTGALWEELEAIMEDNDVETVQYNQWINTDRANLETQICTS